MPDSVILASFDSRHEAEHVLGSLGRDFRKKARKGRASALIVSGNRDGSLKLTQSRVVTGGAFLSAIIHVSASMMMGFAGMRSSFKGARAGVQAARVRSGHVGPDEQRGHQILAEAGPDAALVLVRSSEPDMTRMVFAEVADRARYSWAGPIDEFLADLNPGAEHDWVRTALGEPKDTSSARGEEGAPPA